MRVSTVVVFLLMVGIAIAGPVTTQPSYIAKKAAWRFDAAGKWAGWEPNEQVQDVRFDRESVSFITKGSDPTLVSPAFEWPQATNGQHVELDIDCDTSTAGEFYFTNTTKGANSGFEGKWFVPFAAPSAGRQIVPIWPFWESLGRVVRVRLDPPSAARCRLYGLRIVDDAAVPRIPSWDFNATCSTWSSMYASRVESSPAGLRAQAILPMALIATGVTPFAAERRSVLRLQADCPGEHTICLYWASRADPGLWGEPIELVGGGRPPRLAGKMPAPHGEIEIDLRQYPEWKGTITNLAIGFGTTGHEVLTLRSLAIEENDPERAFLRVRYLGYASGVGRAGRPVEVRASIEHAAGKPLPGGEATVQTDDNASCSEKTIPIAAMAPGDRIELKFKITPRAVGVTRVALSLNNQTFARTLKVSPAIEATRGEYDVPAPRPVETDYQIGIYYYPGWSPDRIQTWKRQAETPEREPLLGWYEEGRPEVADWHIKWAVENGLSFFVYDWYWRDGKEELGAALNEGFLKARYNDRMKFALMWANHKPFSSHTREQLLTVTDYWIEHFLRRPNYLTVDGKPYVSFYSPQELLKALGSPEKVRESLEAMRERVRSAGLPGLHIGAIDIPGQVEPATLKKAGFDSLTAYTYIRTGTTVAHSLYRQYLAGYQAKWNAAEQSKALPYIPLLGVGWDGPVWYGPRSERRKARRTEDLEEGLGRLKNFLDSTGKRMAILEAWNEWGEGSYLEPNIEFGFGDVEAVRKVFARPGDWPINVGPEDAGVGGQYDLRNQPAGCRAVATVGKPVELVGKHPSVVSGLTLRCWENRLVVEAGEARLDDRPVKWAGACLALARVETRIQDLPLTLKAGEVKKWLGGNRLIIGPKDRRNLLPGSYTAGSLRLTDPSDHGSVFEPTRDYLLDEMWGAFSIVEGGRLKAGQPVVARYQMSLRRVDAVVIDAEGRPSCIAGVASADCPEPPIIPEGMLHLANIYCPFNAGGIEPQHIYVVSTSHPDLSALRDMPSLGPVLAKLREGKDVTVVCWGDSVTACGESSTPAKCYVGLLEAMLKGRFPKAGIRVINAGIGGTSTQGRLPAFQKEVLDHHPDVVTLEFVNDMGLSGTQMERNYSEILQRTQAAGAALIILTPHFTMPDWMGLPSGRGAETRAGVVFLREFTRRHGIPLADASKRWELLEKTGVPYETLLRNGINHPEDRGHRIFAEELMRFFPEK